MSKKHLSPNDFKEWLEKQKDFTNIFQIGLDKEDPNDEYIGNAVKPKVCENKLLERAEVEDDADLEVLVREFVEEGGTVIKLEDKKIHIELESGSLILPRFCVKIRKN